MTPWHLKLNFSLHNPNYARKRQRRRADPQNQSVKLSRHPKGSSWAKQGAKKVLFLFKLPIKCCVIHSSEKYSPHDDDDGWIHRPRYLPIKWLHPNTTPPPPPNSLVWLRGSPHSWRVSCAVSSVSSQLLHPVTCHMTEAGNSSLQQALYSGEVKKKKLHKCSFISIGKSHQTDPVFPLGVLVKHT